MPRFTTALFDLDGTLIDSVPDLHAAVNGMLTQLGLPLVALEQVATWVGNGSLVLVERALAFSNVEKTCDQLTAHDLFLEAYAATNHQFSTCFAGVEDCLQILHARGFAMGVVTNKPARFTPGILADLGLLQYFDVVVSGDTLAEKKPSPAPLLYALDELGGKLDQAIMIGDSLNDIAAAKACQMANCLLTYGYRQGLSVEDISPDWHVDRFSQLLPLLDSCS